MNKTLAHRAHEVLGWVKTDDGNHAIIGFRDQHGDAFSVAINKERITEVLRCLIDAHSLAPIQKGDTWKVIEPIHCNRFALGSGLIDDVFYLTILTSGDGHISFELNRQMAGELLEALKTALQGPPGRPSSDQKQIH